MADYTGTGLPAGFWENIMKAQTFAAQTRAPSSTQIALDMIRHMKGAKDLGSAAGGGNLGTKSLSALGWVLDKVERPLYGIENAVKYDIKDIKKKGIGAFPSVFASATGFDSDFWRGFSGKEKVSGADVVKEAGIKNKYAKGILGFGLDVGLDPLTYIPAGTFAKGAALGLRGAKLEKAALGVEKGQQAIEKAQHAVIGKVGEQLNLFQTPTFSAGAGAEGVRRIGENLAPPVERTAENLAGPGGTKPLIGVKKGWVETTDAAGNIVRTKALGKHMVGPESVPKPQLFEKVDAKNWKPTKRGIKVIGDHMKNEAAAGKSSSFLQSRSKVFKQWRAEQEAAPVLNAVETAQDVAKARPAGEIVDDAAQGDLAASSVIENASMPQVSSRGGMGTTSGTSAVNRSLNDMTPSEQGLVQQIANKYSGSELTPVKQANMLSDFTKAAKGDKHLASDFTRSAMGILADAGKHPVGYEQAKFNIMDVIDEVGGHDRLGYIGVRTHADLNRQVTKTLSHLDQGKDINTLKGVHPELARAVRDTRASGLAATGVDWAPDVQRVTDMASAAARKTAEEGGSDPEIAETLEKIKRAGRESLKDAPPSVVRTMEDNVDQMKFPPTPEGQAAKKTADANMKASATGVANKAADKTMMDAARDGKTPARDTELQVADSESPVTQLTLWNRLAQALNPAWGHKQVRQDLLAGRNYHQAEYSRYRRILSNIEKKSTPEQRKAAFREIQNGEAVTPLAKEMQSIFHNLIGAQGVSDAANKGQSVILREGLDMKSINRELAKKGWDLKKWRFSKGYTDQLGNKIDLSNGADWIKSVYGANIDDPTAFLSRLSDAVNSSLIRKTVINDIEQRWGKVVAQGAHSVRSAHSDLFFEPHIAQQMDFMMKNMEELAKPNSQLARYMSDSMRIYKTYFTLPNPNHHVNNNIGNMWFNWMAGVSNPKHYLRSNKVMAFERRQYQDANGIVNLGEDALGRSMRDPINPDEHFMTTGSGEKITTQQFHLLAKKNGILVSGHQAEDIPEFAGEVGFMKKATNNKMINALKKFSESNENWSRYAHFSHELEKSKLPLDQAAAAAAARVRKFHPDGTDLAPWEQKWARNIIPFYSWQRKAIPLALETAVSNPGKVVRIPKASLALANMMGIEGGTLSDPFPEDRQFPSWIRQNVWGPQLPFGMFGLTGYGMLNPSIPTFDVAKTLDVTHPLESIKNLASSTSPLIKTPVEMAMGDKGAFAQSLRTGKEYKDKSEYFSENLPVTAQVMRIFGRDPLGGFQKTRAAQFRESIGQGAVDTTAMARWLGAIGYMDTGRYEAQAAKQNAK